MAPSCPRQTSRIFVFPTASPRPMLMTIFSRRGTIIAFLYPKRFVSAAVDLPITLARTGSVVRIARSVRATSVFGEPGLLDLVLALPPAFFAPSACRASRRPCPCPFLPSCRGAMAQPAVDHGRRSSRSARLLAIDDRRLHPGDGLPTGSSRRTSCRPLGPRPARRCPSFGIPPSGLRGRGPCGCGASRSGAPRPGPGASHGRWRGSSPLAPLVLVGPLGARHHLDQVTHLSFAWLSLVVAFPP